jgi:uncharacterized damage-inducible protein DinB
MKTFLRGLFEYNHQCNQMLCDAFIRNQHAVSERSINLFSHILNAHHIWNARIQMAKPAFDVWQIHPISLFASIIQSNEDDSNILLKTDDLDRLFYYKNSKGQQFERTVKDVLFHVINHSTYHRGQIAADFRSSHLEPVPTDYIHLKR